MRVWVGGGSGFVGASVCQRLAGHGHQFSIVSRTPGLSRVMWHRIRNEGVRDADVVINLAGAAILDVTHRWTPEYKMQTVSSRVDTTRLLSDAIARAPSSSRPSVFIATSAVGIYPPSPSATYDENSPVQPVDFASALCMEIEKATQSARDAGTRVVHMRLGVVLGRDGGAYMRMKIPFSLGLGGPFGSGKQFFPWVHVEDVARAYLFAMENPKLEGPVNVVAPDIITNKEFVKELGRTMRRPAFMPAPAVALNLLFGGDRAKMLLEGQRVVPQKLTSMGFQFLYPTIQAACHQLVFDVSDADPQIMATPSSPAQQQQQQQQQKPEEAQQKQQQK